MTKKFFETTAKYGQTILDRLVCPDKGGAEVVNTLPSIVSPNSTDGTGDVHQQYGHQIAHIPSGPRSQR